MTGCLVSVRRERTVFSALTGHLRRDKWVAWCRRCGKVGQSASPEVVAQLAANHRPL